ncbi:hypothetical protein M407DRAFT_27259 [Tulasnella calospora MUT 4182]|uniref:F-box domain-containing protein n=1 Tax=Tulasnella calospora MUT 4182 TaxID=1051891 RepID=A0A0C3KPD4_9AGAM|nr:hypothetical protein M407DRAFT_27259 [Tulasnella calospora MUT 4182]
MLNAPESSLDIQPGLTVQLSPLHVNDLPYDVFHLIFSICCQTSKGTAAFPVLATHVCRIWRQYALSIPSLWTNLEFRQKKPHFERYRIWLERANGAPFDVLIERGPFQKASVKHAKEIMHLIIPNIASLRTLVVKRVPHKVLRIIFDRLALITAPQLRTLTVKASRKTAWSSEGVPSKWKFKPFIQGEAPKLRELNLGGINPSYTIGRFKDLQYVRLKWSGVFGGSNPTAYDHVKSVQELLTILPNLKYILMGDTRHHEYWAESDEFQQLAAHLPPPFTYNTLAHVSIGASIYNTNAIIASLVLPELEFAIDWQQHELLIGVNCLESIARSSPCPLSGLISLRLGGGCSAINPDTHPRNYINMGYLEGALDRLERLRSLSFDRVNFEDDQYLPCLGRTCPNLEWLRFVLCQRFTMKQVRSIIEARLAAEKKLQPLVRLIVHQWSSKIVHFEEGDREWLEGAVEFDVKKFPLENISGQDFLSVVKGVKPLTHLT